MEARLAAIPQGSKPSPTTDSAHRLHFERLAAAVPKRRQNTDPDLVALPVLVATFPFAPLGEDSIRPAGASVFV